jgi:hypothetical protein
MTRDAKQIRPPSFINANYGSEIRHDRGLQVRIEVDVINGRLRMRSPSTKGDIAAWFWDVGFGREFPHKC